MSRVEDITGQKFNKLTAIRFIERKDDKTYWEFQCDCGNTKIIRATCVKNGNTKSCSCWTHNNLIGQRFGRLVVEEIIKKGAYWLCKCDCGNTKIAKCSSLLKGKTKSCGCLYKDKIVKHRMCNTLLYKSYKNMVTRCFNKSCKAYEDYGGRGITVCEEWLGTSGSKNFITWAISSGYNELLTIDRIDVNGNYEPSNCKWATRKEQNNNKRNNHLITYNNETYNLSQWAERLNIKRATLANRLIKRKWSIEKALTTPVRKLRKPHNELFS